MSICRMRPFRVALLGTFLALLAFGTSAEPRVDAMIEQVLGPLNAAMGILTNPGELTSTDRRHVVDAIQAAINMLDEYRRQSR